MRTLIFAGLFALLAACSSDDDAPPAASDTIVLYPTTKVIDGALVTDAAPDMSRLTFAARTAALDAVKVGDVVLAGPAAKVPSGLLRKVTAVTAAGGGIELMTERAALTDAIERGHIRLPNTRLVRATAAAQPAGGVTLKALHPLASGADSYEQDFTVGIDDIELAPGVKGGASVGFGLGVDVDIKIELKEVTAKLKLLGNESATVDVRALVSNELDGTVPIATIDFPPIPIPGSPVPLAITSQIVIDLGISGNTSVPLAWSATEKASIEAGVSVGTGGIEPIFGGEATASADPVQILGDLSIKARAGFTLRVALNALIGDAALMAGADGYVKIDASLAKGGECFTASRGVDVRYGAEVSLLGARIDALSPSDKKNVFDEPFAKGVCSSDPLAVTPWSAVLGSSNLEQSPRLALLPDQSIVVANNSAGNTGYVARLTPQGVPVWEHGIGGIVTMRGAVPGPNSSVWLGGASGTTPILMRLGGDGTRKAAVLLEGGADRAVYAASKDGGVVLAGLPLDESSTWVAKVDANGAVVWAKRYGRIVDPRAIAETADGGVVVAGDIALDGGTRATVLRVSPTGDPVFARTYADGRFFGVTGVAGGGALAVGSASSTGAAIVVRLDDTGGSPWGFGYESTGNIEMRANAVAERTDGFVLAGRRGFAGPADAWALQISPAGELGWSRTFGGAAADELFAAQRSSDNGVVLAGETQSFGGTTHTLLLRLPPSGALDFAAASGATSSNVDGSKVPVPGGGITLTPVPVAFTLTAKPATSEDWPFTDVPAKRTALAGP